MITEICPVCEKNSWRMCEEKNIWICDECNPVISIEEKQVDVDRSVATCLVCGCNDWWSPIRSTAQICFICQPPSIQALVGRHYFFDDFSNRWLIESGDDGKEIWTKECA